MNVGPTSLDTDSVWLGQPKGKILMTLQYVGVKIVTAWPERRNDAPGYAVKYEDGYISWSPKEAFEKAYMPLHPDFRVSVNVTSDDCKVPAQQA